MRKVLVVGLGGSGAKTLSLMMDELLAELKSNYKWESDRLPGCWKFVSVDVPQVAENLGPGLPVPIDQKEGGKYLGITQAAATPYSNYDLAAFRKFELAHDPNDGRNALQEYARWHSTHEFGNSLSVAGGAGAFRAIGRVLTLSNSERIYSFLKQNVVELMASDQEGEGLSQTLGVTWKAEQSPLVLLVGSMAGGSGASMLLDVADLINALAAEVPGFKGNESAAFAYTPEVFANIEKVATSGGGIALAAISELLSAKAMGSAEWSKSPVTWKTLLPNNSIPPQSVTTGRGPYLTFPIGATTGGVPFGSKPEDVYRGFARVLTPLLSDDEQQDAFFKYVTTNYPNHLIASASDATGLASPVQSSESGVTTYPVFFGGFGSAKLGTGRSRYREYSAQRIARRAVEILVNGFVDPLHPEGNPAVLKARAATNFTAAFFQIANIDGRHSSDPTLSIPNVLASVLKSRAKIEELAADQISKVDPMLQGETSGEQGVNGFVRSWSSEDAHRQQVAKQVAIVALEEWTARVLSDIEKAYMAAVSEHGIEVGELLLTQLSASLTQLHGSLADNPQFESAAKDTVNRFLASMRPSPRVNWGAHRQNLNKHLAEIIEGLVKNKVSELLKSLLPELANQVIGQLKKSGKQLLQELTEELGQLPVVVSTAAYREAPVNQWPATDHVPAYFEPAVNEVLLMKTNSFVSKFKEHLSVETGKNPEQLEAGLKSAAQQVILRAHIPNGSEAMTFFTTWDHSVTDNASHPHVVRVNDWKPSLISTSPSLPVFALKLTTADLKRYAQKWIGVNKSEFDRYCSTSLSSWVSESPANESALKQLLEEAISFAKPLVTIDQGAAQFFHGSGITQSLEFVFSKLPFAPGSTTAAQLTAGKSEQFHSAIMNACDPAVHHTEITIFSRFEGFYSPWAMESLTTPIRRAYETLKNRGNLVAFWKLQRSRTLSQALPVGQDVIDAMLRGYFIGRITGRVQVKGSTVSIFVQPDISVAGRWVEFSKELLGAKVLGISNGGDSTDKLNIPVILLESLPLALVRVYGDSHESMTPYLELLRLGKNLKKNGYGVFTESKTELDEWFVGGSEFEPITKAEPRTDELKAEAERILRVWIKDCQVAWSTPPRTSQDYSWQIFGELAPNIIRACTELIEELHRTDPSLGQFTSSEERFVAQLQEETGPDEEAVY
jgi:hypothetical protein